VANHALAGEAMIDNSTASTAYPLFDGNGWSETVCADCGASPEAMPRVEPTGAAAGRVRGTDSALAVGAVDAVCEQIVAGADQDGDVLVLCGTTLIVWVTTGEFREVPGLWTLPHTAAGKLQIGGPSNAGGLFLGWVDRLVGPDGDIDPGRVPVWSPYLRGERVPLHDPDRRGVLDGLNLTHDGASVRRAAFEASGFVVRQIIEMSGARATRIVATGGGTRVAPWMQGIADATGLPVSVSGVAEGAALGAAFLGRMAAGLESSVGDAARWASTGSSSRIRRGRMPSETATPDFSSWRRRVRHLALDRGQIAHVGEEAHRAVFWKFEPVGGVRVPHALGGDIPTLRGEVVDDVFALVAIDQL
jgi:xylulokinase